MPVFEFIFRKAGEAFNFTKDRLCLSVPLRILKIFTAYISCTPAASYFFHYVIPWSFLLDTIVFSLYLFRWRYWKIISDRLINNICLWSPAISNFSCKHKLHLFELYIFLKNFICFYYYYYYYYFFLNYTCLKNTSFENNLTLEKVFFGEIFYWSVRPVHLALPVWKKILFHCTHIVSSLFLGCRL